MQAGTPPNIIACVMDCLMTFMIESLLKTLIIALERFIFWTKARQRGRDYMPNMKNRLKKSDLCKKKINRQLV